MNSIRKLQHVLLTRHDVSNEAGRALERYRRIAWSAIGSIATRGIGILGAIITTPLTLRYLGEERFGLWMTISSISSLMSFADLGIGSGLLNAISRADGANDKLALQQAVSSAFFLLMSIAGLLLIGFGAVFTWIPWPLAFNLANPQLTQEASYAAAALIACIALNLPLGTAVRVQMGFQEGFQSSLWSTASNILSFGAVLCAALYEAGLPWLILAFNGVPVVVTLVNWLVQFTCRRRWLLPRFRYFDRKTGQSILGAGGVFVMLQLVAFVGFFSDNFLITQFMGAAAVAPYAIMFKVYSAAFVIQHVMTPLWPALNEAIARGDKAQARSLYNNAVRACLGAGLLIALGMTTLGRPLVEAWVGKELVPEWSLLIGFSVWTLVAAYNGPMAALLSGSRTLIKQLKIFSLSAVLSLTLKMLLLPILGVSGAIWGAVIGYGIMLIRAQRVARQSLNN